MVSIGPGSADLLTERARRAISESSHIIGNALYIDQVAPLLVGKTVIRSHMGREVDRTREAVRLAADHVVSMLSGGDAGLYGMAGIVVEYVARHGLQIDVEVIPGVTAALAAAARLGSPISGDCVCASLSDLLIPWDEIKRRLDLAFQIGVPVALYNPKSRGRPGNFLRALEIAGRYLPPSTPVGIVRDVEREDESIRITTLERAAELEEIVDMHTILIIGGRESRLWKGDGDVRGIITPRGYHRKYSY
ncbi:MAG: precorrin-3B C(17)-methyltransferase [Methanoculleaceae archaeon]